MAWPLFDGVYCVLVHSKYCDNKGRCNKLPSIHMHRLTTTNEYCMNVKKISHSKVAQFSCRFCFFVFFYSQMNFSKLKDFCLLIIKSHTHTRSCVLCIAHIQTGRIINVSKSINIYYLLLHSYGR